MATRKQATSRPKPHLDLDAATSEERNDGLLVRFRGEDYTVPAELPADVLVPLIDPDLALMGVVKQFIEADDPDGQTDIVDALLSRPDLPSQVWEAFNEALRRLFDGPGQEAHPNFDRFQRSRPSLKDYVRLVVGLFSLYGVGLGEASEPSTTSEPGGGSSKETSSTTTE